MATIRTQADLDAAQAAFNTAVQTMLTAVTALTTVQTPEMTYSGAVANADLLASTTQAGAALVALVAGFTQRAADACAQIRPLLPAS